MSLLPDRHSDMLFTSISTWAHCHPEVPFTSTRSVGVTPSPASAGELQAVGLRSYQLVTLLVRCPPTPMHQPPGNAIEQNSRTAQVSPSNRDAVTRFHAAERRHRQAAGRPCPTAEPRRPDDDLVTGSPRPFMRGVGGRPSISYPKNRRAERHIASLGAGPGHGLQVSSASRLRGAKYRSGRITSPRMPSALSSGPTGLRLRRGTDATVMSTSSLLSPTKDLAADLPLSGRRGLRRACTARRRPVTARSEGTVMQIMCRRVACQMPIDHAS